MLFVPAMWIGWILILAFFLGAKVYASRISRYEETQLILDESSSQLKTEQDAITGRLNKFRPVQMTTVWLLGAGTLFVVAYYIHDMINQFK
ncbi:MAG: hypothetical protein WAL75_12300 [Terracidiphilus sp.]